MNLKIVLQSRQNVVLFNSANLPELQLGHVVGVASFSPGSSRGANRGTIFMNY